MLAQINKLINDHLQRRFLWDFGGDHANVLDLNLALDVLKEATGEERDVMDNRSPEQERETARRAEGRPDPEELLRKYGLQDQEPGAPSVSPLSFPASVSSTPEASEREKGDSHHRRGRLRVYLAAAAGAGKTYAMLNEGHRRENRGTDVVVGYVETHGRSQTQAQLGDLEVLPRKHVTYRGVTLEEMDLDAILARHPHVVLVDELAHTNVPGSRHPKRYQDVLEILDAGKTHHFCGDLFADPTSRRSLDERSNGASVLSTVFYHGQEGMNKRSLVCVSPGFWGEQIQSRWPAIEHSSAQRKHSLRPYRRSARTC